jgi:hypothetical protein
VRGYGAVRVPLEYSWRVNGDFTSARRRFFAVVGVCKSESGSKLVRHLVRVFAHSEREAKTLTALRC